jgi:hypothetical protein
VGFIPRLLDLQSWSGRLGEVKILDLTGITLTLLILRRGRVEILFKDRFVLFLGGAGIPLRLSRYCSEV